MVKPIEKQSTGIKGGKRPGAGRKRGVPNKKTAELQRKVEESGVTPLEVMLRTMRALVTKAETDPKNPNIEMMIEASAVAKDAAPYIHPKLSSVEMNAKVTTHEASLDELA